MTYNQILQRAVEMLQQDDTVKEIAKDISLVPTISNTARLLPAVHVILEAPYSTSESVGYTGETDTQYTEKIDMKIIVGKDLVKQSVLQLNDLMEAVYDVFVKNRKLASPDGSDPMFVRSVVDVRADAKNAGQTRQTATVSVTGQVGEDILLQIKDFVPRLYVLHESGGTDAINRTVHLADDGNLDGYASTGRQKSRTYILEDTKDGVYKALQDLQDSRDVLTITSTTLGEETKYKAHISRLQPSLDYASKPIISLQFDVI